jgi:hypothetical protein
MRIHEAIEKAGPGGKIRRNEFDSCYVVGEESVTFDAGITEVVFHPDELTATDWEVIEPETIEVGDVVREGEDGPDAYVVAISEEVDVTEQSACIRLHCDGSLKGAYPMSWLTLIRKGPKKHVFEGVSFQGDIDVGHMKNRVMVYQHGQNPLQIKEDTERGKTYRMTLEPMED